MNRRDLDIDEQIERLKRRIQREVMARKAAEELLEQKSLEVFSANQKLQQVNSELNEALSANVKALNESEAERFTMFDHATSGIALVTQGRLVRINERLSSMLGLEERDVLEKPIIDFIFEEDRKLFKNSNSSNELVEIRLLRHPESMTWISVQSHPVKGQDGKYMYDVYMLDDIQQRKNAAARQELLVQQLQETNSQLEDFARIVSHDLKAPLNGIKTVIGWINESKASNLDEEFQNYLGLVTDRADKMYRLIDGVMQYSKAVNTEDDQTSIFNVGKAVEEAAQFMVVPKHIKIRIHGEFPEIRANWFKTKQLFSNLIDNAIRHIDKPLGEISITCSSTPLYWTFRVTDNGKGIKKEHFNKIFKIFSTMDTSGKHTGIGLSLVSKIVEQYGGEIGVDSEFGKYTTFKFTFNKETVSTDGKKT